jgi:hypothetical protein
MCNDSIDTPEVDRSTGSDDSTASDDMESDVDTDNTDEDTDDYVEPDSEPIGWKLERSTVNDCQY